MSYVLSMSSYVFRLAGQAIDWWKSAADSSSPSSDTASCGNGFRSRARSIWACCAAWAQDRTGGVDHEQESVPSDVVR